MPKAATAIALMVFGMVAATPTATFVATDAATGRTIFCRPLADGERIALAFTHSMYGGDVVEDYVATRDGRLRRVAMTTEHAAAAEYYASTVSIIREGDRFRLDLPVAAFDEIVVRVDRVGEHRLLAGDDRIDLVAAAGDRRSVVLDARAVGLIHHLVGRSC